jgi:hypothetical protein
VFTQLFASKEKGNIRAGMQAGIFWLLYSGFQALLQNTQTTR